MKTSNIIFIVAILVLIWFGTETFLAQEICVTGCMDLSGIPGWQQAIAVVILPVILVLFGMSSRRNEKAPQTKVP